jgi:excisionase family DNA binding protein
MHTAANRRYVSPSQAAKELGMSTSTVYRAIENGYLPAIRLRPEGALRIPADALVPRRRP